MTPPELIPLAPKGAFGFTCHAEVPCFNHCCRDLNQALTPYDVMVLRSYLNLTWQDFKNRYADLHTGPISGLPIVTLRFEDAHDRRCPFVTSDGCRVYAARPASCRLYPLARSVRRSRSDGTISEHYALLKEPHCHGFNHGPQWTVDRWVASQHLESHLAANDQFMELIAIKNQHDHRPLPPSQQQWMVMALYDLDTLKQQATLNRLEGADRSSLPPIALCQDDNDWLNWGMTWIRQLLFGAVCDRSENRTPKGAVEPQQGG